MNKSEKQNTGYSEISTDMYLISCQEALRLSIKLFKKVCIEKARANWSDAQVEMLESLFKSV